MQYYVVKEALQSLINKSRYADIEELYDVLKREHAECLPLLQNGGPTRNLSLVGDICRLLDAVPFQFTKTKEEYGDRHPRDIQAVLAMADAPLNYDIRHFDD